MTLINSNINQELEDEVRGWRRDIHAHPEMAFQENRTSKLVAKRLKSFGYSVQTGIAKTGVIGTIKFGPGPSIALRADMDALPILEQNNVDYASKAQGCMHACGHDGHTAIMLGVAKVLSSRKDLSGTLHIIFQPAEENEAGAQAMLDDGLLDKIEIDAIYALHNMPGLPVGQMQVMSGPMLASFDKFEINIKGAGGHGAFPEKTQDTILTAAQLILALNTITSRSVAATDAAIISVGHIEGLGTYNVIPERIEILGSCRSLKAETRDILKEKIAKICEQFSSSELTIICNYMDGYPSLINDTNCSEIVTQALSDVVGAENVTTDFDPIMGSEDFAFFLNRLPGCYFLLGNGADSSAIHTPTYDFNDAAAKFGIAAFVRIIELTLGSQSHQNGKPQVT